MAGVRAHAKHRVGPYQLAERIGYGGMAEVYVARRVGPHGFSKRFALKRILPQLARDARFAEMFCDEARICAALTHPNIVQVVDFGEDGGELFMAMEFVDGISCARLLRSVAGRGETFPVGASLYIANEVLRALAFAHKACDEHGRPLAIVHRDVSPGNILISSIGEVKLSDFGIVRSDFVERRTCPGELKGKMGYMSPEQAIGAEVDARSDIFAVGIVLAEMLVTRPLFPGRSELEILTRIYESDVSVLTRFGASLPRSLLRVLYKALDRKPERRFQTADEFSDAIRGLAREQGYVLDDGELIPWLSSLGILPSASGTHEVSSAREPRAAPRERGQGPELRAVAPRVPAASPRRSTPPGESYFALNRRGAVLGPLRLPRLLELLATGRIEGQARISVDGKRFAPLRSYPELAHFAARREFRFFDNAERQASWRHPITRETLPGRVFDLVLRRETGLLVAHDGRRQKRVYFVNGSPVCVASTDRSELLGQQLVQAGLVGKGALEGVLEDPARRVRVGEALVARGALGPTALLRSVVEQVESRFAELGFWRAGELSFVRGEESTDTSIAARTAGPPLAVRLVREGYTEDEIAAMLAPRRHEPLVRAAASGLDLSSLGLTRPEALALARAGKAKTLEDLVLALAGRGLAMPSETLRAVFIGISAGVLAIPGWPSQAG